MKNTTKKQIFITRFILTKDYVISDKWLGDAHTIYRKGRVLQTIRSREFHYHPRDHNITMGHGLGEFIPAELIKAKWFVQTKTVRKIKNGTITKVTIKEVPVTPLKR